MRNLALAALITLTGAAFAADAAPAVEAKAVNTVCPGDGKAVDAKAGTVAIKVEGKDVVVGVCSKECNEVVTKADEKAKALIAKAAAEGKIIKDGKVVDAPKAH